MHAHLLNKNSNYKAGSKCETICTHTEWNKRIHINPFAFPDTISTSPSSLLDPIHQVPDHQCLDIQMWQHIWHLSGLWPGNFAPQTQILSRLWTDIYRYNPGFSLKPAGFDYCELRVNMSLGHPQVPVGLSVGNPQVKWPTDLSFWMAQVFTDLVSTSVEAGTCYRYPPYLSLNLVLKFLIRVRDI